MITFENVNKIYKKKHALKDFSWQVETEKINALLGHNGCGKTTSFLIANKLIPFNSGSISVFGKDISKINKNDMKRIGFLTEKLKLYEELNVKDTLSFFCDLFSVKEKKKKISELSSIFGLTEFMKKDVKKLSTGMYKKTAIAVTMINDPEIIFLDEPFSGLDPVIVRDISNILREYRVDKKKTIILSSHNLHEVEAVSENITIMKDGEKVLSDSLKDIFSNHSLEKSFDISYLSANSEVNETVKDEHALYEKLKVLKENNHHITTISENKISLNSIYNKIYGEHAAGV